MNGRNDGPSTALIFPSQATTEGELVELKTELKQARKGRARLGVTALVLGAFAVSGVVGSILMAWHLDSRIDKAEKEVEAEYEGLTEKLTTAEAKVDTLNETVTALRLQNSELQKYRNVASAQEEIKDIKERVERLRVLANTQATAIALPDADEEDLDKKIEDAWKFQENISSDNWVPLAAAAMKKEQEAREAYEKAIINKMRQTMESSAIRVRCTRTNPFNTAKNPICAD